MGKTTLYSPRFAGSVGTLPPTLSIQEMSLRMAKARQRLAIDRQAEIDREAMEASSASVVGAVTDLDGMVG